jgi:anti-sigma-K factor RskA
VTTTDCSKFVAMVGSPTAEQAPALAAHLAECADCRAAAQVVALLERTRAEPEQRALFGLAARVAARRRQGPSARWRPAALAAGAIGAAALLAVFSFDRAATGTPAPAELAVAGAAEQIDYDDLAESFALEEFEWDEESWLESDLGADQGPI